MKVLGLIPARGGSKGVPRKNIRELHGKPLLAYTATASLGAKSLSHVVLSTDDEEIANIGRSLGLDVPFLRPAKLALDGTPTFPVVLHALAAMEAIHGKFDAVCLLQPTSPLRTSNEINECVEMLDTRSADTVFSMLPVPERYNPHWVFEQDETGNLRVSTGDDAIIPRRQSLPPAFHRDGAIYVTRRNVVVERESLYGDRIVGYVREVNMSVDIDTIDDWKRAESMSVEFAAISPPAIDLPRQGSPSIPRAQNDGAAFGR